MIDLKKQVCLEYDRAYQDRIAWPLTDSCVSCQARFALNGELATVPAGHRIAFDPAQKRIWRICTACSEWNLVGPEAAAAAIGELEVRFTAARKAAADNDTVLAHLGNRVELMRLGVPSAPAVNDVAALKRRNQIERRTKFLAAFFLLFAASQVWEWFTNYTDRLSALPFGVVSIACVWFIMAAIDARHTVPMKRVELAALTAAFIVGWGFVVIPDPRWWLAVPVSFLLTLAAAKWGQPLVSFKTKLPNGTKIRLNRYETWRVLLTWSGEPPVLSLHRLPDDRVFTGSDAIHVLRALLKEWNVAYRDQTEPAWELLRSAGGLRGLLRVLDGFRLDDNGGVMLEALPDVYKLALDMALAEWDADDSQHLLQLEGRQDAVTVAAIAEQLHRGD